MGIELVVMGAEAKARARVAPKKISGYLATAHSLPAPGQKIGVLDQETGMWYAALVDSLDPSHVTITATGDDKYLPGRIWKPAQDARIGAEDSSYQREEAIAYFLKHWPESRYILMTQTNAPPAYIEKLRKAGDIMNGAIRKMKKSGKETQIIDRAMTYGAAWAMIEIPYTARNLTWHYRETDIHHFINRAINNLFEISERFDKKVNAALG